MKKMAVFNIIAFLLSNFLTLTAATQSQPSNGDQSQGKNEDAISKSTTAQPAQIKDKSFKNFKLDPSTLKAIKKDFNFKKGMSAGGIQGGGGGNYTVAKFWESTTVIKKQLTQFITSANSPLSKQQLQHLISIMNPDSVELEIYPIPLYLTDEKGIFRLVDAINFPKTMKIQLVQDVWSMRFEQSVDVLFLIFHEFLGLANIPDDNYRVSLHYFPTTSESPNFELQKINCQITNNSLTNNSELWSSKIGHISSVFSSPQQHSVNSLLSYQSVAIMAKSAKIKFDLDKNEQVDLSQRTTNAIELEFIIEKPNPAEFTHATWLGSNTPEVFIAAHLFKEKQLISTNIISLKNIPQMTVRNNGNHILFDFDIEHDGILSLLRRIDVPMRTEHLVSVGKKEINLDLIKILLEETYFKFNLKTSSEQMAFLDKYLFVNAGNIIPIKTKFKCEIKAN